LTTPAVTTTQSESTTPVVTVTETDVTTNETTTSTEKPADSNQKEEGALSNGQGNNVTPVSEGDRFNPANVVEETVINKNANDADQKLQQMNEDNRVTADNVLKIREMALRQAMTNENSSRQTQDDINVIDLSDGI